MGTLFEGTAGDRLRKTILVTVIILAIFLAFEAISVALGLPYTSDDQKMAYTITVDGHGEILAVPDIATFNFAVVSDKATVADAQADAATKANAITAYLIAQGIATTDIQTTDYSVSPQYEYQNAVCPQIPPTPGVVNVGNAVYCPSGKQVLTGYEVSQQTTVKVRNTSTAGDILSGVGSKGATQVSGLTFTTDDPEALTDQARTKAVADAQTQAEALAKSLGVSLGRITSFSDNGGSAPSPQPYGLMEATASDASAPAISPGQNKVTDDVSLTYEIH
jgi:uncharacterized protein